MIAEVSDDGGGISSERTREKRRRERNKNRRRIAAYAKSKKRLRIDPFNLSLEFQTPIPAATGSSSSSATRPVLRLSPDDVEYVRSTMEEYLDSELSGGQYRGGTTFDFLRLSGVGDVTYGDSHGEQEMMRRRGLLRSVRQGQAAGLRGLQEEEAVVFLATTTATLTVSGGIASFLLPSSSSIPPSQDEIDVILSEGLRNPNFREKLKEGKEEEDRSSNAAGAAAGGGVGAGVDFAAVTGAGYAPLTASPTEAPSNPPTMVLTALPTPSPSEDPASGGKQVGTADEGLGNARFPLDDGTNDAGIEPRDALAAASDTRGAIASDDGGGGGATSPAPLIGGMAAVGLAALAISYGLFAKKRQRKNGRGGTRPRKGGDSDCCDDSGSLGLKSTDKLTELHALDSMRIREDASSTVSSGDRPFRGYRSAGGGQGVTANFDKLSIPEDDTSNVVTIRDDVVTVRDAQNGKEEQLNVVAVQPLDDSDEHDDETDSVASSGIASIFSSSTFGQAIQTLLGRRGAADSSLTRDARPARTVRTKESFEEDRRTMNCAVRKDMLSCDFDAHGGAEAACSPPPPIAFDREGSVLAPSFFAAADVGGEPSSEPNFVNLEFEPDPIWDPDDCDDDDVDGDDTMNSDAQSSMEVPFCEAPLTSTSYEDGMFEGSRRDRTDRIVSYQMDFVEAGGEDPQFV